MKGHSNIETMRCTLFENTKQIENVFYSTWLPFSLYVNFWSYNKPFLWTVVSLISYCVKSSFMKLINLFCYFLSAKKHFVVMSEIMFDTSCFFCFLVFLRIPAYLNVQLGNLKRVTFTSLFSQVIIRPILKLGTKSKKSETPLSKLSYRIDTISNFAVNTKNEIYPSQAVVKIYLVVLQVEEDIRNRAVKTESWKR